MEKWKDVVGFEGYYVVSDIGRVKSLKRTAPTYYGKRSVNERILKAGFDVRGYEKIKICSNDFRKMRFVHRLVAEAFIPNPLNRETVNHINGIKTDNRVENLEWCTSKENISHAWKNGLMNPLKGVDIHTCRLTEKEVLEIRASGEKEKVLSERYGVAKPTINHIRKRRSWKHV